MICEQRQLFCWVPFKESPFAKPNFSETSGKEEERLARVKGWPLAIWFGVGGARGGWLVNYQGEEVCKSSSFFLPEVAMPRLHFPGVFFPLGNRSLQIGFRFFQSAVLQGGPLPVINRGEITPISVW